ncbi:hypothetical protein, partial [Klenkia sp. PcliD-1-E]|uniref:hypothetical protein n=1 Tax=Klenkia sp. PcliD-1-E TaxID=2954492 RepID=UPI002097445B
RSSGWSLVVELGAEPLAYAVLVLRVAGTLWTADALRTGAVGTVTPVLATTQAVVPGLVGLALLGDRLRPGWAPVLAVGLVLTVAGVALLARGHRSR